MPVSTTKKLAITLLIAAFATYSSSMYMTLPSDASQGADADRGKMLWQQHNCTACHQIYGLGGFLGPDLTNVYSKKGAVYIRAFLQHGTNIMPDFGLSEAEIKSLTSYLAAVDASGSASPKTFTIHKNGTIEQ